MKYGPNLTKDNMPLNIMLRSEVYTKREKGDAPRLYKGGFRIKEGVRVIAQAQNCGVRPDNQS